MRRNLCESLLLVMLIVTPGVCPAQDIDLVPNENKANTQVWLAAADQPGYDQATAWSPDFDNRRLWAGLCGKERFLTQTWKKTRLLVWAHPGESGGGRKGKRDTYDPQSWIDAATGKPPQVDDMRELLDGQTDFLIPAADQQYVVSWKVEDQEHARIEIRHLTIGRNAGWYTSGIDIYGNVWVKAGGTIGNHGACSPVGSTHTFFRNDNPYAPVAHREKDYGSHVSQYLTMNKPDGSCEFIGAISMTDEFRVYAGTMVVAADTEMHPGRNATPIVETGATLALMDGAWHGKIINQFDAADMICRGTISGGLPDRPLTRNCTFSIGFKNWPPVKFSVEPRSEQDQEWNTRRTSLVLYEGAKMVVHSTDLAKARMICRWHQIVRTWAISNKADRSPYWTDPTIRRQFDSIPRKTDLWCGPGVMLDGILLEDLHAGGLMYADQATRDAWRNVEFGESCKELGGKVYQELPEIGRNGVY